MTKSGITKADIFAWAGPAVFKQALILCSEGVVKNVAYNPEKREFSGKIEKLDGWGMPVSFSWLPDNRVKSRCPCRQNQLLGQICYHVVAIGIAQMIMEMDDAASKKPPAAAKVALPKGKALPAKPEEDESRLIPVVMQPTFSVYVAGSRASLSIELDAHYEDVAFPACSVQRDKTVWLPDPDDSLVRRTRNMPAEQDALREIKRHGFERAYRAGDPKFYLTNPSKLLTFLGAGLPALHRLGWHIELADKLTQLTDTFTSIVPVVTVKDAPNGDFDIAYHFDAHGEDISPIEIQAALNRGDGYIRKGEEVMLLDYRAIEQMHAVFTDCAPRQNGAPAGWFRVPAIHAAYVKASLETLDVEIDDARGKKWRTSAALRNREKTAMFEPIPLGDLEKVLRPYQKQGVYWMNFLEESGFAGLLADEMGLGKTIQTLAWLSLLLKKNRKEKKPALVVCPTSLVRNWEAEAHKFTPNLETLVLSGYEREEQFRYIPTADLVITSYGTLQRDIDIVYSKTTFSAIVLDEAQHIKNRRTKTSHAVKRLLSEHRFVLTGTPIENSVADVWSIFDFLLPGYLGNYEIFRRRYSEPILQGGSLARDAQDGLRRKIHPFIMRRLKKSVAKDLPDKIVKISYCPMSEEGERKYLAALSKTRREAGNLVKKQGFDKSRIELLALLMKLRQIASLGKLDAFYEQLEDAIEGGHKILVFSQFLDTLGRIAKDLTKKEIKFCYLDGSTKERMEECNRFNRSPDIPVFLISLMAGGTGLNLTGADMVMHFDPWWNPAVEDQATDRAHRIGQKKTVYAIKMISSHTIEEKVLALQRRKQAVIAATIQTTDVAVMEKLSAADLNELLA